MKRVVLLFALPLLMIAAEKPKETPRPAGVPAEAKQEGENSWRYTDAEGKVWIYRKMPYGLSKLPADMREESPTSALPADLKAKQVGNQIQFERPGPFGVARWLRDPDQMSDLERRIWERDRPKNAAPADGKKSAPKE